MKHKIVLSLLLILLGWVGVDAQMKTIELSQEKPNPSQLMLKPKQNITHFDRNPGSTEFKTLGAFRITELDNGLKAGMFGNRNVPLYIEGTLANSTTKGSRAENQAYEYLRAAAPLMKIKNPDLEFSVLSTYEDELGMTHIKMQQMAGNVPVYGGEVILHSRKGAIEFLNGHYFPSIKMESLTPVMTEKQTLDVVKEDLGASLTYEVDVTILGDMSTKTELVVLPMDDQTFRLAYHLTGYKNLIERWEYFVDAIDGEIIRKHQSICKFHHHEVDHHAKDVEDHVLTSSLSSTTSIALDGKATASAPDLYGISRIINTYQVGAKYYMIDGSREIFSSTPTQMPDDPSGVIWTLDAFNTSPALNNFRFDHVTSNNNTWNSPTSVSAHYNGGKAYEYFRNTFNRASINGSGGNIISLINVIEEDGKAMDNAFWNGQAMFYGNGNTQFFPLARGLDVAGHEMSHGVIQSTANLEYRGESGALNESFADVFGVMIDRDDWLIGEDVVRPNAFPSGALRSMSDPHNGAANNDFGRGWQPSHYNERYTGSQDNGGVHINSGIPNHAFYKFASAVGKDKAEKVYYRALTNYLTKSSQFVDARVAVVKAAGDLYSTAEVNAAKAAFTEVGILGDEGGDYEQDVQINPGQDFVLTTGSNNVGLYLMDAKGQLLGQLNSRQILSKPSISDDGSEVVYIGGDKKMYYLTFNWQANPPTYNEQLLSDEAVWRNVIISKDGLLIGATTNNAENHIYVFYFGGQDVISRDFELYNPTYTTGVVTGDVNFADAMEFDLSGKYIMYDAENELRSGTGNTIKYWDVSFIEVWNNATKTFTQGEVSKLFSSLPKDVSVGNATFSKNSPYIIAFDYIDEENNSSVLGANIEKGNVGLIFENNTLGFPNYSGTDQQLVFEYEQPSTQQTNLGIANLKQNKIEVNGDAQVFSPQKRWAVWFRNGARSTAVEKVLAEHQTFDIDKNPVSDVLSMTVISDNNSAVDFDILISDLNGKVYYENHYNSSDENINVNISDLNNGLYIVTLKSGKTVESKKFVKI
ncbi:MAG: M4 family metallopeptidase [Saprospiraceae bacterium]|nr:MAG: bacillolysin [Bacteroidetes bacterium OLB9]MCO6464844.1 M4 family metallopeptidase [Saprospiraceae bacterium]